MRCNKFGVALIALLTGCGSEPVVPLPGELIGVWQTDEDRYLGRAFEVSPEVLYLGTGQGTFDAHQIDAVREGLRPAAFLLEYSVGGGTVVFDLTIGPDHIYLTNQPEVRWTRWEDPTVPWRS